MCKIYIGIDAHRAKNSIRRKNRKVCECVCVCALLCMLSTRVITCVHVLCQIYSGKQDESLRYKLPTTRSCDGSQTTILSMNKLCGNAREWWFWLVLKWIQVYKLEHTNNYNTFTLKCIDFRVRVWHSTLHRVWAKVAFNVLFILWLGGKGNRPMLEYAWCSSRCD